LLQGAAGHRGIERILNIGNVRHHVRVAIGVVMGEQIVVITPRDARPNIQARPMATMPSTAKVWPKGPRVKVQMLFRMVAGEAPPVTVDQK